MFGVVTAWGETEGTQRHFYVWRSCITHTVKPKQAVTNAMAMTPLTYREPSPGPRPRSGRELALLLLVDQRPALRRRALKRVLLRCR